MKDIKELEDFTKKELIQIEFYNRCYDEGQLKEIKSHTKQELIDCILNDQYCFYEEVELRYGSEEEIIEYILKNEIYL